MVMLEGDRLEARPLVYAVSVNESTDDIVKAGHVDINNQPHTLQRTTVHVPSPQRGAVVFVVDPGSAVGPAQIIATRPR